MTDEDWMWQALALARQAQLLNEVPVGALVVLNQEIIGCGYNQPISSCDPSAHAEIIALREAAKTINNYRLIGAELYVTIEPCFMCAGALVHSRIKRLIFGANEPRAGAVASQAQLLDATYLNHRVEYTGGVCAEACADIINQFFTRRR